MAKQDGCKNNKDDAGYVIGVDIGASNLRLALADLDGFILDKMSTSINGAGEPDRVVATIGECVDQLLSQRFLSRSDLRSVAAGAPGVTDCERGIVVATSYLMGWHEVPLKQKLEAEFLVPVAIDNDVNLAALGEGQFGIAKGVDNFVFLAIGTGLGAGIVLNGNLFRGNSWTAGEVGYMLVPGVSEEPAKVGEPGALESMVGGEGIRLHWQKRWSGDKTPFPKNAGTKEIFQYAQEGDVVAQQVLQVAAKALAYAIYNISLVLNCPLFILGGSVGMDPVLGDAASAILETRTAEVQPNLVRSSLGTDAQLIGAVAMAIQLSKAGVQ